MLRALVIVLALWLAHIGPAFAEAGKRVALVIGNSNYGSVPALANPVNDASDIAAALTRLDFDVTLGLDLDDGKMRTHLRDFARAADTADLSLVYYAGHGIEIDQTNYLIPVNAELRDDRDANFETVPLDAVMRALAGSGGVKLVLVDACRNNPFAERLRAKGATRSIGQGLARVDPVGGVLAGGILVGYAAREGTVALDGQGRNSPYAAALLEYLEEPGLEVSKLFRKVRDRVFEVTAGQQEPFTYGALPGRDVFLAAALPAGGSPGESTLLRDFSVAEASATLAAWTGFLDTHGAQIDNGLVRIAMRRKTELEAQEAERRARENREPWLVPASGRKAPPLELTQAERLSVQKSLNYMGFDTGGLDGAFGPKTRQAISRARAAVGLPPGTVVSLELLRELPDPAPVDALKSKKAVAHDPETLDPLLEPRLKSALQKLHDYEVVFDYFQGHLYLVIIGAGFGSWDFKNGFAGQLGGHLVTINSAEENAFVVDLFLGDPKFVTRGSDGSWRGPVIGLFQRPDGAEPGGGWEWVTGEPLGYTNWGRGQPDHDSWREDFARFHGTGKRPVSAAYWNDAQGMTKAFIVEFE